MMFTPPLCPSEARRVLLHALLWVAFGLPATGSAEERPGALEFESQPDGKCQILSTGGKLVLLRNRNTDRAVKYRLIRYFADHVQNRVDGVIPAAGAQPLGCDTVDGRSQRWVVERFKIEGE